MNKAFIRWAVLPALGLIALLLGLFALVFWVLLLSLPVETGERALTGLENPATVERDAAGIAVIRAESIEDAVRAQGFVHAQERFFQMDLLRRLTSGRLAALLGDIEPVIQSDRMNKTYGFTGVADGVYSSMPPFQKALVDAYTEGVNAGLEALGARPPEYFALQSVPEPWAVTDCMFVGFAMHEGLSFSESVERMINVMDEALPRVLVDFLTPSTTRFDSPVVDDAPYTPSPMPTAEMMRPFREKIVFDESMIHEPLELGSNNWVIAPERSASGFAMLANDMHLQLGVPNTWHRTELRTPGMALIGVSFPGMPGIVVGSNTHIAWGFTNVTGDFQDLVRLRIDPKNPSRYLTPDGPEQFGERVEVIEIRGSEPIEIVVYTTRWGPVVEDLHDGSPVALAWPALSAETNNFNIFDLYRAQRVEDALDIAAGWYGPPQNVVVADRDGAIGWTPSGYFPKRIGFSGSRSVDWSSGELGWASNAQHARPRVMNPESGYIVTANARTMGLEDSRDVGANWAIGCRAGRIAELIEVKGVLSEKDMLAVQLDTDVSAVYETYRAILLSRIAKGTSDPTLARVRRYVSEWRGTSDTDEQGMTILSVFRSVIYREAVPHLVAPCKEIDEKFSYGWFQSDEVLLRLLDERPVHFLPDSHDSWDVFLDDALAKTIERLGDSLESDAAMEWGVYRRTRIGHPLSLAVPQLSWLLDAPQLPVPGHPRAVRVQGRSFGASERLVVSPGNEAGAILHMPTGQVLHLLSRQRFAMHEDWARGTATPLIAGEPERVLSLTPALKTP